MYQKIIEPDELEEPRQLVFEWTWGEDEHRIAYEIEVDTDELYRNHTLFGSPEEKRVRVAQFIDADLIDWKVSFEESGGQTVKITVAASVGGYKMAGETPAIGVVPGCDP